MFPVSEYGSFDEIAGRAAGPDSRARLSASVAWMRRSSASSQGKGWFSA